MTESVLDLIVQAMSSPWLYPALFALAVLDALIAVMPSETAVITAGVFAATGGPDLLVIMAVAAAGAMIGDHLSYAIGRRYGVGLIARLPETGRRRNAFDGARTALMQRGGSALLVARYVPGGRTAVTLTTGAIRFPLRSFVLHDAFAAVTWAVYCTLVGYIGGAAFEDNPLLGVLLGLGLALGLAALLEVVRWVRGRSSRAGTAEPAAAASQPAGL